jgi:hypothetical protein
VIDPSTFLSGETGHVAGIRRTVWRTTGDALLDASLALRRTGARLDRLAAATPKRTILVLGVYRPDSKLIEATVNELLTTHHDLRFALGATGEAATSLTTETVATGLTGGKFQNLNELLTRVGVRPLNKRDREKPLVIAKNACEGVRPLNKVGADWVLVVDDDVALPARFLDRFVAVCEALGFALAQPAQTLRSHAAWRVVRRRPWALARETRFVEIGPVTAFRRDAAEVLVPFPDVRFGWGLDLHWGAVAAQHGWRVGIVDALPVQHQVLPVASSYDHEDAIAEAQAFLAGKQYVRAADAQETLAVHR